MALSAVSLPDLNARLDALQQQAEGRLAAQVCAVLVSFARCVCCGNPSHCHPGT